MSANSYDVLGANPSLTSLPDDANLTLSSNGFQGSEYNQVFVNLREKLAKGHLVRFDKSDCIRAYATTFQSTYGNLILITDDVHATEYEAMYYEEVYSPSPYPGNPFKWICLGRLDGHYCSYFVSDIRAHASNWVVNGHPVNYCLSEKLPEKCKVQYSLPLAIVAFGCNIVTVTVICYAALTSAATTMPILTYGDAIASFLRTPDETTKGQCMVSRERLGTQYGPQEVKYHKVQQRWGSAVSVLQWQICLSSYVHSVPHVVLSDGLG